MGQVASAVPRRFDASRSTKLSVFRIIDLCAATDFQTPIFYLADTFWGVDSEDSPNDASMSAHEVAAHPTSRRKVTLQSESPSNGTQGALVLSSPELLEAISFAAGTAAAQQLSLVSRATADNVSCILPALSSAQHGYLYTCGRFPEAAQNYTDEDEAARFCWKRREWQQLPPMLEARTGCAIASVGGFLYTMGGKCAQGERAPKEAYAERYDPVAEQWQSIPPLPGACSHAAAVAAGGRIYVFGGLRGTRALRQVLCFDPTLWNWTSPCGKSMEIGRFECAAALHRGRIFIVGGSDAKGTPLEAVECYNTADQAWNGVASLTVARYGCAAVAGKSFLMVLGGRGKCFSLVSAVESFNDDTGLWSTATSMPIPRMRCGAIAAGEHVLIFGGRGASDEAVKMVSAFHLSTERWQVNGPWVWTEPMSNCVAVAAAS